MINSMGNLPNSAKREIKELEEIVIPLARKSFKYTSFSLPLIAISVMNLVPALFFMPKEQISMFTVLIYAVLGAVGMALSKEANFQQKEMQKRSSSYVIERIKKSNLASNQMKIEYIGLVEKQPSKAVKYFIKFLEEENRNKLKVYQQ
ncbi:MAG TPA: DUF5392 family protein [Chondromyces sp.]|nr:DUF5392 family protein [Chondromyces sp.]